MGGAEPLGTINRANDELEKSSRCSVCLSGVGSVCSCNAERLACRGSGGGEQQAVFPSGGMVQRRESPRADAGTGECGVSTIVERGSAKDQGTGIQHRKDLGGMECGRAARGGVSPGESGFAFAASR